MEMQESKWQRIADAPDFALISIGDACLLLSRSRSSLYRDFKAGRIQPVKAGCSTRIRVGDLRAIAKKGGA